MRTVWHRFGRASGGRVPEQRSSIIILHNDAIRAARACLGQCFRYAVRRLLRMYDDLSTVPQRRMFSLPSLRRRWIFSSRWRDAVPGAAKPANSAFTRGAWRCASLHLAHCPKCGNFDLDRISRERVDGGALIFAKRLLRFPAYRCDPCRERFFSIRHSRLILPSERCRTAEQGIPESVHTEV